MSAPQSRPATPCATVHPPVPAGVRRRLDPARLRLDRGALIGYGQLLTGAGGRVGLQVAYFFILANTLSLSQMGVFASVSAAGAMIGCLAGFGFQSLVMRAAAGRRALVGGYLAAYYACVLAALPVMIGAAALLYVFLFVQFIPVTAYVAIVVVEIALWRQIELLVQVNNGLGRYGAAATLVSAPVAFRAAAAVAFWAAGGGDAAVWSGYYLASNAVAAAVLSALFHPRTRLRLRLRLLRGRLGSGLLYTLSYVLVLAQGEVDKLIILALAGERTAGVYAIAMRVTDMTGVPIRPVFMMFSRKLIRAGRATAALLRESLLIELGCALASVAGVLALVVFLRVWPAALGPNVGAAAGMMEVILIVPAVRNLLEFHGELFFSLHRMGLRAVLTVALLVLKGCALALSIAAFPRPETWGLCLNAVYGGVYAVSAAVVYAAVMRGAR